ncbi:XkdH [Clostridium phage A2]|uniref:DUF3599 family protein n=1 Tax=Enterococcus faecium TaxID=1352 RepID=UPI00129F9352|nr:DUF3599 family protein [Enterococcus faecium]AZF89424.1 hypothetical protein CPD4_35 [Clostridium phage CPD4]QGF20109.1 hypothetical protein CPAS15_0058 [Clostridium phage CPAS-15]WAB24117.1 XkdH [Clostridium phage A2]WAB24194.1 XkdH [Clostridium phage C2]WAB24271.1 XkdH [Clostridium phage H1]WAB24348.1 XkdH [Clostridium phage D1]WAB24425.1 XkdH [Clostridium phage E1]
MIRNSYNKLLNHRCNIYHLLEDPEDPGYGLAHTPSFSYPDEPDMTEVPCHFKSGTLEKLEYKEPRFKITQEYSVDFAIGTDVRQNDKIVDLETGITYIAKAPRDIRGLKIKVGIEAKDFR